MFYGRILRVKLYVILVVIQLVWSVFFQRLDRCVCVEFHTSCEFWLHSMRVAIRRSIWFHDKFKPLLSVLLSNSCVCYHQVQIISVVKLSPVLYGMYWILWLSLYVPNNTSGRAECLKALWSNTIDFCGNLVIRSQDFIFLGFSC